MTILDHENESFNVPAVTGNANNRTERIHEAPQFPVPPAPPLPSRVVAANISFSATNNNAKKCNSDYIEKVINFHVKNCLNKKICNFSQKFSCVKMHCCIQQIPSNVFNLGVKRGLGNCLEEIRNGVALKPVCILLLIGFQKC